jgi:hypothetical protein
MGFGIVLVHMDDILIVSDSLKWIESAKRAIGDQFRMTDFGEAKFILGMDIVRNIEAWTISLSIDQYTKEILKNIVLVYIELDNTPSKVPMAPTHYREGEVASDHLKVGLTPPEHETFRPILVIVTFMCMCIIRNLAFTIIVISMHLTARTQLHMK